MNQFHKTSGLPLVTLILLFLSLACASLPTAPYEIDLKFVPSVGMRLSWKERTTVVVASRRQETSEQKVMHITAVDDQGFEARLTEGGRTAPATFRYSREWVPQKITPDSPDEVPEAALAKFLSEHVPVQGGVYRRWRTGEMGSWRIGLAPSLGGLDFQGTMTFLGVTAFGGRLTAEFEWSGTGTVGLPLTLRMALTGKSWFDVASGIELRTTMRGRAEMVVQGQGVLVEVETEKVFDRGDSRGI